ncbi:NAD(P)-dependent oxidoreductase [Candidatus Woesearchaeota archaeon]|nr:NAD(P)-dependent oxidoreductase [Candidatus Woesearchaeota archaeon]
MDIGVTGTDNFLGKHMFDRLKHDSRISSVEAFERAGSDILNKEQVEKFLSGKDAIIHLAAVHRADDITLMRSNLLGTLSLVRAISQTNPKCRLLFSSSFQVYSKSTEDDVITEGFPLGPGSTYGFCKKFEEDLILSELSNSAVFRISNIYGPGCRPFDNSVVATFIHLAKEGKAITITGDGNQSKDFVFVDDIVDAFELALFSKNTGAFNLCSGESVSINRIAELLKAYFPGLNIARKEAGEESLFTRGDYGKAEKVFGWKPKTSFEHGLKKCV